MPNFCGGLFDYDNAKQRQEELAVLTADPALWDNQEKALKLTGEKNTLDENIAFYEDLLADLQNSEEMVEMAEAEEDEAMLAELFAHLEELKQEAKRHELEALLSGELDKNDAYLEVHAGSAEPRRRIGRKCCSECIRAGRKNTNTNFRMLKKPRAKSRG